MGKQGIQELGTVSLWKPINGMRGLRKMALEKNENYFELTDDSDRASAIEAQFNEDALEEARRRTAPETSPDFDGKHCIECGEKIPAARLKLGKIRCIECQSLKEQKTKFFGG